MPKKKNTTTAVVSNKGGAGGLTPDQIVEKKELEEKIVKMKEDREAKCSAAKTQLIDMLAVTADKYRTATGVAEALRVVRFVDDGKTEPTEEVTAARQHAATMAAVVLEMKEKAEALAYEEMDKLCEGFYDEDFCAKSEVSLGDLIEQMMRIDLCRNVGGAAEDMVAFIKRVDEEIAATEKALSEIVPE